MSLCAVLWCAPCSLAPRACAASTGRRGSNGSGNVALCSRLCGRRRRSSALRLVEHPRLFHLECLRAPTLVPPRHGLGACLLDERPLAFRVQLLCHIRRTLCRDENAEAAPEACSDGLPHALGAAGDAVGGVELDLTPYVAPYVARRTDPTPYEAAPSTVPDTVRTPYLNRTRRTERPPLGSWKCSYYLKSHPAAH